MKVIVCLDKRGGMLFNDRRQSRDRVVYEDVTSSLHGRLYCSDYSSELFKNHDIGRLSDYFASDDADGVCFVEKENLAPFLDRIDSVTVYRWDKIYPADKYIDIDLGLFRLIKIEELQGNSHNKILKEVYVR